MAAKLQEVRLQMAGQPQEGECDSTEEPARNSPWTANNACNIPRKQSHIVGVGQRSGRADGHDALYSVPSLSLQVHQPKNAAQGMADPPKRRLTGGSKDMFDGCRYVG